MVVVCRQGGGIRKETTHLIDLRDDRGAKEGILLMDLNPAHHCHELVLRSNGGGRQHRVGNAVHNVGRALHCEQSFLAIKIDLSGTFVVFSQRQTDANDLLPSVTPNAPYRVSHAVLEAWMDTFLGATNNSKSRHSMARRSRTPSGGDGGQTTPTERTFNSVHCKTVGLFVR